MAASWRTAAAVTTEAARLLLRREERRRLRERGRRRRINMGERGWLNCAWVVVVVVMEGEKERVDIVCGEFFFWAYFDR